MQHNSLFRLLFYPDLQYCNTLLTGLPANSIKPLQLIQNSAARLIFDEPKRTHVTPLFINLHWLPIAARIKFKALLFAYKTTSGSTPLYLNSVLQPSQGPSATASTTRRQAAGNGRGPSLRGHDRQDKLKQFLRARQYLKIALLAEIRELDPRDQGMTLLAEIRELASGLET